MSGPQTEFRRGALPLSAGVCAFAEGAVRFAEMQPDSAVIFATSCDQLRRGFDAAIFHGQSRAFLFNLPATQTPAARQIYRAEMERLGRFLVELGGHAPTPDILRREIRQAEQERQQERQSIPAPPNKKVPLALVGGPLTASDRNLLEAIEAAGGCVALNATENGERSLSLKFDWDAADDPFDALVTGYFENIVGRVSTSEHTALFVVEAAIAVASCARHRALAFHRLRPLAGRGANLEGNIRPAGSAARSRRSRRDIAARRQPPPGFCGNAEMNATPRKLNLAGWDGRYAQLHRQGLREPAYGGPLRRHVERERDFRLRATAI